ncbi:uncharacterized protein N7473_000392 [Penicillium subrubescens]|uniref:uncharacterized protein n=1 Tax=Penicillium subrubescens TaxID=1316194 RepID=UPI002544DE89|nr:uncharacterized protein N7473_000392 [Penicillium subrubescens]KAJ5911089.1 hypothetical protein N7473_000392 [Penicillium subrubescens]
MVCILFIFTLFIFTLFILALFILALFILALFILAPSMLNFFILNLVMLAVFVVAIFMPAFFMLTASAILTFTHFISFIFILVVLTEIIVSTITVVIIVVITVVALVVVTISAPIRRPQYLIRLLLLLFIGTRTLCGLTDIIWQKLLVQVINSVLDFRILPKPTLIRHGQKLGSIQFCVLVNPGACRNLSKWIISNDNIRWRV